LSNFYFSGTFFKNIFSPTHVVAGSASLFCTVQSQDQFGNTHANPLGFMAANMTFDSVPVVHDRVETTQLTDSSDWRIVLTLVPNQEGILRVVYYMNENQTAANEVRVHVVRPSAVASQSVMECPTTTVAGSSLSCIVSLKNASGMKVIDTPVGGADSSLVDMVAITLHVSGAKHW
jgi:hypothetical protein